MPVSKSDSLGQRLKTAAKKALLSIPFIGSAIWGCARILRLPGRLVAFLDEDRQPSEPAPAADCTHYLGDGMILAKRMGFKMLLRGADRGLTPHILLDGCFCPAIGQHLSSMVKPGMTVLDIGANVGYFTLLASRAVGPAGKVYAFEPEPGNFRVLSENLFVNGMTWATPVNKALWNTSGSSTLFVDSMNLGGATMISGKFDLKADSSVAIEMVALDSYLPPGTHVDFIKLDAEGAEPKIIEGMAATLGANRAITILMEFCPQFLQAGGNDPSEFIGRLRDMGFAMQRLHEDGRLTEFDIDEITPSTTIADILLTRI